MRLHQGETRPLTRISTMPTVHRTCEGMVMLEEAIRFFIMCHHELCGEAASVGDHEGFNAHLNMEQTNKLLITLLDLYRYTCHLMTLWASQYGTTTSASNLESRVDGKLIRLSVHHYIHNLMRCVQASACCRAASVTK